LVIATIDDFFPRIWLFLTLLNRAWGVVFIVAPTGGAASFLKERGAFIDMELGHFSKVGKIYGCAGFFLLDS
jgi:hypothetical protein